MPKPTLHRLHFALRRLTVLLAVVGPQIFGVNALAQQSGVPQMDLERVELTAGMYRIQAQVAQSPQARSVGLMHRAQMPQAEGMLFIFDAPGVQCFWMKNTLLPLTAAFVADDGTVVNLADMQPQSTDSHCSSKPVRHVLEMNQGWFKSRAIKAGFKLSGPVFAGVKSRTAKP